MIYIITHKKFDAPLLDNYQPMQVGAEGKEDLGYLKDNTGDNISIKNPQFCELTGLYWIWKNANDDYKGLVHYRRYFGKSNYSRKIKDIYSYDTLIKYLDEYDMVVPYVEIFKENAKEQILVSSTTEDAFNKFEKIFKEMYPEYIETFDNYFTNNKSVLFNMFVCKKEIFDAYCEWMFPILFELEKVIDLNTLDNYQKRIYGFFSERLLNIYIAYNKLNVKHLNVVATETSLKEQLVFKRRRITNGIYFKLHGNK